MGFKYEVDKNSVVKVIQAQRSSTILNNIPEYLVTPENCMHAVKANGLAVQYVPPEMLTKTLIVRAIQQNHQAYFLVKEKDQEQLYLRLSVKVLVKKIKEIKVMDFKF